jgi:hypothetical protein
MCNNARSEVQSLMEQGLQPTAYSYINDLLFYEGLWHHLPSIGRYNLFLATQLLPYPIYKRDAPFLLIINVANRPDQFEEEIRLLGI